MSDERRMPTSEELWDLLIVAEDVLEGYIDYVRATEMAREIRDAYFKRRKAALEEFDD